MRLEGTIASLGPSAHYKESGLQHVQINIPGGQFPVDWIAKQDDKMLPVTLIVTPVAGKQQRYHAHMRLDQNGTNPYISPSLEREEDSSRAYLAAVLQEAGVEFMPVEGTQNKNVKTGQKVDLEIALTADLRVRR